MRVLILHSRYLSGSVSGENRVVEDQATLLREAGFDVHVWAPSAERLSMTAAGVNTIWSRTSTAAVRELLEQGNPDVVHVHNVFPMLSPAVLRVVGRRFPLVTTLHNYRFACLPGTLYRDGRVCQDCVGRGPWPGVFHGCYRNSAPASAVLATSISLHRALGTYDRVDRFIALSEFMKERLAGAGLPIDRTDVLTNFSWPTERRSGPGEYLLYIGRLAPEKGLADLLRMWRRIDAPFMIVGEGPEEERLRTLAPDSVEFRPSVPGPVVPQLVHGARAVVVPSRWFEGAPRAIIESYAAGVPVLASRIGALPELVRDDVSGFLISPGDLEGWRRAVATMMDDAASERLGEGAHRLWQERHRPEDALAGLERSYRRATEMRRRFARVRKAAP